MVDKFGTVLVDLDTQEVHTVQVLDNQAFWRIPSLGHGTTNNHVYNDKDAAPGSQKQIRAHYLSPADKRHLIDMSVYQKHLRSYNRDMWQRFTDCILCE